MDKILEFAKMSKRLALDEDTQFRDARSNLPSPADFGEHEEIPEEAMTVVIPIAAAARSLTGSSITFGDINTGINFEDKDNA